MPPIPLEYQGREVVARLFAAIFRAGRRFELVPTRANRQPAFGAYLRAPGSPVRRGVGLVVLTLGPGCDRISACSRFDGSMLQWFALPSELR